MTTSLPPSRLGRGRSRRFFGSFLIRACLGRQIATSRIPSSSLFRLRQSQWQLALVIRIRRVFGKIFSDGLPPSLVNGHILTLWKTLAWNESGHLNTLFEYCPAVKDFRYPLMFTRRSGHQLSKHPNVKSSWCQSRNRRWLIGIGWRHKVMFHVESAEKI